MRSSWEVLHAGLMRSIEERDSVEAFAGLRARREVLDRFSEAGELVEYMAHPGGDLYEKDRILAALIEEVRRGEARLQLAYTLLLLCLWPGLQMRRSSDDVGSFGARARTWRSRSSTALRCRCSVSISAE